MENEYNNEYSNENTNGNANVNQNPVSEENRSSENEQTIYRTRWTSDDPRQDAYAQQTSQQQTGQTQANQPQSPKPEQPQSNPYTQQAQVNQQSVQNPYGAGSGQQMGWSAQPQNSWNTQQQYQQPYQQVQKPKKKWFHKRDKNAPKRPDGFGMKLMKCAAMAAVFGLIAGGVFQGVNYTNYKLNGTSGGSTVVDNTSLTSAETTSTTKEGTGVATDISGVVDNVMPSIVAITTMSQTEVQDWFGQTQTYESEGAGSGIIVSQDNDYIYIATNNHVVDGAETLTVCFTDDTTASGEVKGTDSGSDLAVVSVKKADVEEDTLNTIKVATLGSSDDLVVGEAAIAIGNALGYGQSVTTGVISAVDREVSVQDETTGETTTSSLIQTDAAINPGNSGGALINSRGEVIGINSVKYSDTTVEGMGYAIPITTAGPIIEDLINREVVDSSNSAYLGISGVDVTSSVASTYSMPEGIYVAQVTEGSAADNAGIVKGDVITSFDGHEVTTMEALQDLLQYYAAGTEVEIVAEVSNNGQYEEQTFTVTLGKKN